MAWWCELAGLARLVSVEGEIVAKALLFDVGDVLMESNWAVLDLLEAHTGRVIPGRGPLAPEGDPDWQEYLAGRMSYYDYWQRKATAGGYDDYLSLWRAMSIDLGADIFAADGLALVDEARAAGIPVGILSNDLIGSAGREWVDTRPELAGYDVFIDCTEFGIRKPAPEPYLQAIADFELPAEEIVFLDDTPMCIEGARDVGMIGVHIDPLHRQIGFDRARALVGLTPQSRGARLVRLAETVYGARDLAAAERMWHPEMVMYWNGVRVAEGTEEARQFHIDRLGFNGTGRHDYVLRKHLRAEQGDTICDEWESSYRTDDGSIVESRGSEFWTMRFDLILEWHAYNIKLQ
jgi:putative hydrolase of the HAD superfamily